MDRRIIVLFCLASLLVSSIVIPARSVTGAVDDLPLAIASSAILRTSEVQDLTDLDVLGGGQTEWASDIAQYGDYVYVVGYTASSDWPATVGAFSETLQGGYDFVVACYRSDLTLRWSTFIGGELDDYAYACTADSEGVTIVGYSENVTTGNDFPVSPDGLYQTNQGNFDAVVCKLARNGTTLLYSTFLGGYQTDKAFDVAQVGGYWVVTGSTESNTTFPLTSGAEDTTFTGTHEAFLCILNRSHLVYSSFIGGTGFDEARSVEIGPSTGSEASAHQILIGGISDSGGGFGTTGALKTIYPGAGYAAWLSEYNFSATWGATERYSTWLGSVVGGAREYEFPRVAYCEDSETYHLAASTSYDDWPTSSRAYQLTRSSGGFDAWIGALRTDAYGANDLRAGSYFGGSNGDEHVIGIAVDGLNRTLLVGSSTSAETPTMGRRSAGLAGSRDLLVARFAQPALWGMDLLYSSLIDYQEYDEAVACIADSNQDILLAAGTTDTGATVDQDILTMRVVLPDAPLMEILKLSEPNTTLSNATGQQIKVIANVTPYAAESVDAHGQTDHVELVIWHVDDDGEWASRMKEAELTDPDVPEIFGVTVTLTEEETGEIYYYFDAYAEDNGRNRTSGYFVLGEAKATAKTPKPPLEETPLQALLKYIIAIAIVAIVMAWALIKMPAMYATSNAPLVILASVCGIAGLVFGAALIPYHEALIIFGYGFGWAYYVGATDPIPPGRRPKGIILDRTKRFLLGLVVALVGLGTASGYYVLYGTASMWWPIGFGVGAAAAGIYRATLGRKITLRFKWLTLKRVSLVLASLASIVGILVALGVI